MRADRLNDRRVDELRAAMKMDEDRLALILADARMVAKDIEQVIDPQPETKTRERIRNQRSRRT